VADGLRVNAGPHRATPSSLLAVLLLLVADGPAQATWAVGLAASSAAEASAGSAPAVPTGVTAACTSLGATTVTVSWSAVANATSYTISQSTTSSTTGYAIVATGISGSTWTSAGLPTGTYWYEVSARIGNNWASGTSAASAQRTILVAACL